MKNLSTLGILLVLALGASVFTYGASLYAVPVLLFFIFISGDELKEEIKKNEREHDPFKFNRY